MKSDEFIREVNEELQQDKLKALWNQYGAFVIAGAVLVVAATGGAVGWQSYQASQLEAQGSLRMEATTALANGDHDAAAQSFSRLAQEYGPGPGALAAFGEAAALLADGNDEAAAQRLSALADLADIDPVLSDLAKLKAIQIRIDSDDPQRLIAELEPLASAGSPFALGAREQLAIAAIRAGDLERAQSELLRVIEDAFTPDSLQARATELFQAIGGEIPSSLDEAGLPDIEAGEETSQ